MENLLRKLGIVDTELYEQPLTAKAQATANTAGEKITFDVPCDQLLYGIDFKCAKDTDGALASNITEVELKLDGAKTIRNLSGAMLRAENIIDHQKGSTGFYHLPIAHPELGADPISLNQFSSCQLTLTVGAAGSGVKNNVTPVLQLGSRSSYPKLSDIGLGKVLVEQFLPQKAYGANTGEQEYEHMRANEVLGYMYELGDNGTLSDSAFSYLTVQLWNSKGKKTLKEKVPFAQIKEQNTVDAFGNALGTGIFYVPFPSKIRTTDYTSIKSLLNIASAGTNCQARVLERYMLGGV
ncbi:MAG: hypothetical protein ACQCN3_02570 [Candidatus Bathyarchaeia archaeon]